MVTIAVLSPLVPERNPANAGEKLVWNLCHTLQHEGAQVTIISDSSNNNRKKETDFKTVFVDSADPDSCGMVSAGISWLGRLRRPVQAWTPHLEFLLALAQNKRALHCLKAADIIDLQWSSMVLLAPLIRRINPTARLVGTLHDINAQRLYRRAHHEKRKNRAAAWRIQGRLARILENRVLASLDQLVVLSEKDAGLLYPSTGASPKVQVVSPPIYDPFFGDLEPSHPPERTPTFLLMGSMYRWENQESLHWLVKEVLPLVWAEVPQAQLAVVGPAPQELFTGCDRRVKYCGLAETISEAYRGVWAALVPLRLGAGVKFKTVDALLAGVPVVATYAGAEGVYRIDWLAEIAESPQGFAAAMVRVIKNRARYAEQALGHRAAVMAEYGTQKYSTRVKEVYDL